MYQVNSFYFSKLMFFMIILFLSELLVKDIIFSQLEKKKKSVIVYKDVSNR